jgi:hypothetical protein
VTIDGGADRRAGVGGVTLDVWSRCLVSFSFSYPTEMDVDTVIKKMSGRRAEVYSLCPSERVVLALESCPKISVVIGHGSTTPYPSSLIQSPLLSAVAFLRLLPLISSPLLHPPPEQVCISTMPVGRGHATPLPRLLPVPPRP